MKNHSIQQSDIDRQALPGCICLLKGPFELSPFYSCFKLAIQRRNVSRARRHNAKRKMKNVQHHQLPVHPSIHPQTPVSHGLPERSVAKPSFPIWWRCPAARRYHAAGFCHFRAYSVSVMSAVLFKNIYTWASPCAWASMQVMPYWFSYCISMLWLWRGIMAWPIYQSLVCVISCHATVRSLSRQIRYIVSLNVLSSTQLELLYETVRASGTKL